MKDMDKNFELYNEEELDKILEHYVKGMLDKPNGYELCCLYDDIDKPNFSVYLAVYDDTLCWTLNRHNNGDCNNFENVWAFYWKTKDITIKKENLYEYAVMILKTLTDNYKAVQKGIQITLE